MFFLGHAKSWFMKLTILLFVLNLSQALAGCEDVAQEFVHKNKHLKFVREGSILLLPGMQGGTYHNRWKSTVEVFFLEESDGDSKEYSALLIHASECRALERQVMGETLN